MFRKYFSNIILGFNDALVSLAGALVGFASALRDNEIIFMAGLITGLSASLSMAASAYLQARHETGRQPLLAAGYTGGAYALVACVLVAPFALASTVLGATYIMIGSILLLVVGVSILGAQVSKRPFHLQLLEMMTLSIGVAVVAFFIGEWVNQLTV